MKNIGIIIAVLFTNALSAQLKTNFNNSVQIGIKGKFNMNYKTNLDFVIPLEDKKLLIEQEISESKKSNNSGPFKHAKALKVDIDIAKNANFVLENDIVYGKFLISAIGALSTSINFDEFYLPEGTEMYVYNKNGNMIIGAITKNENNKKNTWGSWPLKGEELIIEFKTPKSKLHELKLHCNNLAYGYKPIYLEESVLSFGESAPCNINVLCPLGNGWQGERNSVAMILNEDGTRFCSGSLIMNTCGTYTPNFLTANHCFETAGSGPNNNQDVSKWRFIFQYWSPNCTPNQDGVGTMINGSTLKARWDPTDFCLVELYNIPHTNSGLHYAGWNRNTNNINQTTIIHHPVGDVMKITRDNEPPVFGTWGNFNNSYWQLALAGQFDQGATEGGTSGAPYFDQNHRIIGQHRGSGNTNVAICNRIDKWGGRFDLSWAGGGTPSTRLSDWLDPTNLNINTTNTTNFDNLGPAIFPSNLQIYSGYHPVHTGGAIRFYATWNVAGVPPIWQQYQVDWYDANNNQFLASTYGGANSQYDYIPSCIPKNRVICLAVYAKITYLGNQCVSGGVLTSNVSGGFFQCSTKTWNSSFPCYGPARLSQSSQITAIPNPTKGKVQIRFNENISNGNYQILNSQGIAVKLGTFISTKSYTELDLTGLPNGLYTITLTNDKEKKIVKVVKE